MSLDKFSKLDQDIPYKESENNPFYEYQYKNQYEKAKFINPHDIAGNT